MKAHTHISVEMSLVRVGTYCLRQLCFPWVSQKQETCIGLVFLRQFKQQKILLKSDRGLNSDVSNVIQKNKQQDALYAVLDVEVKGHDPAVLRSYQQFVTLTASELDINLTEVITPPKHFFKKTLLKSVHIFKKHRVQYEMRTHYKVFKFRHMTGSTADTFLEYIQRNIPEGVAMKVTKESIEALPDHLKPPVTSQITDKT